MKNLVGFILARYPKLYENLLRVKGNVNSEKILFLNLIQPNDIVFDVGANQGHYTILFSHLVGSMGEVHAFEPLPTTFATLSKEISKFKKYDNIYLNNSAVSDTNSVANIYIPEGDHRQASLTTHKVGSWSNAKKIETYECQVIKLDDYARSLSKQRLDFIKLDVEGAELLALKGFSQSLKKFRPLIYLEIFGAWTKNFNYEPLDIIKFLMSLGYLNFYLLTSEEFRLVKIAEVEKLEALAFSANLLCAIPEVHNLIISRFMK